MKIQLVSDIHLEFYKKRPYGLHLVEELFYGPEIAADVLVVAGDLWAGPGAWKTAQEWLRRASGLWEAVMVVLGNHEGYRSSRAEALERSREFAAGVPNLHFLENDVVEIKGQRFVGTTLWFPPRKDNQKFQNQINDFRMIADIPEVYEWNHGARKFLDDILQEGDVVITHFLPSERSVDPQYEGSELNRFFVSPEDARILEKKPALWLHGHTHCSMDYKLGVTRIVCNPMGYTGMSDMNLQFKKDLILEAESRSSPLH